MNEQGGFVRRSGPFRRTSITFSTVNAGRGGMLV
jgi:hypothetical protein